MLKYTITCCLALLLSNLLQAQDSISLARLSMACPPPATHHEWKAAKNNKNEIQLLFSGLFLTYKAVFSSQDGQKCTFTPSCSEYGIMAIKHHGLFKGIFMTTDRLMRCNGLSPEHYTFDQETFLLVDPLPDEH